MQVAANTEPPDPSSLFLCLNAHRDNVKQEALW